MKRLVILVLFLSFSLNSYAQKTPTYVIKRATLASEYISSKMSFNESQKKDLYTILLYKYDSNRKSIKGKGLSQEERQKIYKASFNETKKSLLEKFSMKDVNMINKLHREWQKNNKK